MALRGGASKDGNLLPLSLSHMLPVSDKVDAYSARAAEGEGALVW